MERNEIIAALKPLIKPYVKDDQAFKSLDEKTDFLTDLKINSANLVDIILDIEERFEIVIDNESMEKMLTVQAALDIVETKLAEK